MLTKIGQKSAVLRAPEKWILGDEFFVFESFLCILENQKSQDDVRVAVPKTSLLKDTLSYIKIRKKSREYIMSGFDSRTSHNLLYSDIFFFPTLVLFSTNNNRLDYRKDFPVYVLESANRDLTR